MSLTAARFDVNLSILFTELPLLERPAAAAAAGFGAVELWWPWIDSPTPGRTELDALERAIEDAGTQLVGLNFYAGPAARAPTAARCPFPARSRSGSAPTSTWPRTSRLGGLHGAQRALRQPRRRAWTPPSRTRSRWRTWYSRPAPPTGSARPC